MGQHVEILLCSVDDAQRAGLEHRHEGLHVDRQRVDECDALPARSAGVEPCHLDQGEFRVVRAFTVELGVQRVAVDTEQRREDGIEL